ncbi:MAG: hypothetical protein WBL53_02400 [Pseudonocardiaceae bacterium]
MAVSGDDQDMLLPERPDLRAVLDEPDFATRLTKHAVVDAGFMRRRDRRTARLRLAGAGPRPATSPPQEQHTRMRGAVSASGPDPRKVANSASDCHRS